MGSETSTLDKAVAAGAKTPLDRLRGKKPVEQSVDIYTDPQAVEHFLDITAELETARDQTPMNTLEVSKLVQAVGKAKEAVEESIVTMRFRSIGRKKYEALVLEHPATEAQVAEYTEALGEKPSYNGETFPVALIAASCVSPVLTLDDAQNIFDEWNSTEMIDVFQAALMANSQTRRLDLGNE